MTRKKALKEHKENSKHINVLPELTELLINKIYDDFDKKVCGNCKDIKGKK